MELSQKSRRRWSSPTAWAPWSSYHEQHSKRCGAQGCLNVCEGIGGMSWNPKTDLPFTTAFQIYIFLRVWAISESQKKWYRLVSPGPFGGGCHVLQFWHQRFNADDLRSQQRWHGSFHGRLQGAGLSHRRGRLGSAFMKLCRNEQINA